MGREELGSDTKWGSILLGGFLKNCSAWLVRSEPATRLPGSAEWSDSWLLQTVRHWDQAVPPELRNSTRVGTAFRGQMGELFAPEGRVRPQAHSGHRPGDLPAFCCLLVVAFMTTKINFTRRWMNELYREKFCTSYYYYCYYFLREINTNMVEFFLDRGGGGWAHIIPRVEEWITKHKLK